MSEPQREYFKNKAQDLHVNLLFKNANAKTVPINAKKGTRVITMVGTGELHGIEGKRFLVNLDDPFPFRPAGFFKNEIKLL